MIRNVVILVVLAGIGLVAYRYFRSTATPDAGPPIVAVTVPELSEEAKAGAAIYDANCALCHGKDAAGQDGVAPPLVHRIYEPNHHGDASFYRAAAQGVPAHHWRFGNMPPVPGVSEDDVARIIVYVRELQRANGIF